MRIVSSPAARSRRREARSPGARSPGARIGPLAVHRLAAGTGVATPHGHAAAAEGAPAVRPAYPPCAGFLQRFDARSIALAHAGRGLRGGERVAARVTLGKRGE